MRILLAILVLVPLCVFGGSGNYYSYSVNPKSKVALTGTTNVNSYECVSNDSFTRGYLLADLLPGSNAIYFSEATLGLRVESFDCGNRLMNRDFHNALGAAINPFIEIELIEARALANSMPGDYGKIRIQLSLVVNGVSKQTDMIVDFSNINNSSYTISGSINLRLSDFKIDPPSPALGLVKVRDQVTINFNLQVETILITHK